MHWLPSWALQFGVGCSTKAWEVSLLSWLPGCLVAILSAIGLPNSYILAHIYSIFLASGFSGQKNTGEVRVGIKPLWQCICMCGLKLWTENMQVPNVHYGWSLFMFLWLRFSSTKYISGSMAISVTWNLIDAFLHRFEWSQIVLLKCFLPYIWGIVSAEQTMWWYQAYYLAEAWSTTWPQQLKPFWWPMQAEQL